MAIAGRIQEVVRPVLLEGCEALGDMKNRVQ
jgi:hypothetical protein